MRPRLLPVAVAVAAGLAGVSGPVRAQEAYEANPGLLAPEGYVIFLNVAGPLSYATLTPRDLPPGAVTLGPVKGRAGQLGVTVPVSGSVSATRISGGGGEGGFDRAVRDIQARHPDVHGIYDVKVDEHVFRILTFVPRLCMEITALGFR